MAKEIDISLAVIKEMYPGYFDDPDKLQALGCDYANGEGVEQNNEVARALWEKAAEMGDIGSMTHLGNLYYLADYEGHDEETAFEWYWKAGQQGEEEALFMVGVFFDNGYVVDKDETMAFYCFRLAAYRGATSAQFNVGWDYQYGVGVPQNYKLAGKWYQLACEQGSKDAMNQLGQMYADGLGVQKDEKEAFRLVSASALMNNPQAMVTLGDFYEQGIGCERSNKKALEWYMKARENGNDPKEKINKIKKMEKQVLNSKALNLIMEARHDFFRKDDQRKNLHDPLYLWQHGYVPDTPLMRVVVKDIMFCSYQYQPINSDNYLVSDGTDYEKLKRIFSYDYGIDIDVQRYYASHRLFRLMQYIEMNISEEYRKAVLDRAQQEKKVGKQLFQLLCNCCDGRPPKIGSNPAFVDIDFKKFEEKLYKQYHMLFSPYERRQLNSINDILRHLIFRIRDGANIKDY